MLKFGVVGFGSRAEGMLVNFNTFEMGVTLTAVCDINLESAKAKVKNAEFDLEKVHFYEDFSEMMQNEELDGLFIGTNCDTHAEIAIEAMKYNVPLLIEKPVAIEEEELDQLEKAYESFGAQTLVSFPLRVSTLCTLVKEIIDRGELGKISQIQAYNNATYGRVYYKDWYRDETLTGGLFLQKATHDLDYINFLLGEKPVSIAAMESKVIFKGNHEAGLKCSECPEYRTCPESPYDLKHNQFQEVPYGEGCSFAKDTGNHDSASIMVMYENGVHATYTQNFVVRKEAASRGARIIGYKATLEFEWNTGEIRVYSHTNPRTDLITVKNNHLYHYGGDKALCENFVGIMKNCEKSKADLKDGIISARMCLKARESARHNTFQTF